MHLNFKKPLFLKKNYTIFFWKIHKRPFFRLRSVYLTLRNPKCALNPKNFDSLQSIYQLFIHSKYFR